MSTKYRAVVAAAALVIIAGLAVALSVAAFTGAFKSSTTKADPCLGTPAPITFATCLRTAYNQAAAAYNVTAPGGKLGAMSSTQCVAYSKKVNGLPAYICRYVVEGKTTTHAFTLKTPTFGNLIADLGAVG